MKNLFLLLFTLIAFGSQAQISFNAVDQRHIVDNKKEISDGLTSKEGFIVYDDDIKVVRVLTSTSITEYDIEEQTTINGTTILVYNRNPGTSHHDFFAFTASGKVFHARRMSEALYSIDEFLTLKKL